MPTLLVPRGKPGPGLLPTWEHAPLLDDYVRLPMPIDAIILRIQALLLEAGFALPQRSDSVGALDESGGTLVQMVARFVSAGQRVVVAADRGLPLVLADPHGSAQITRDIAALAARIMGADSPEFEAKPETAPRRSWKLS